MILKLLQISFFLFFMTSAFAKLQRMPIYFGGPLENDCSFIDSPNLLGVTQSLISALESIQDTKAECQSIYTNTRAYLDSYMENIADSTNSLQVAYANKGIVSNEIKRLITEGSYNGEFDVELFSIEKDIRLLENKDVNRTNSILSTMMLGSTLMQDLQSKSYCQETFSDYVLRPSLGILSTMSPFLFAGDMVTGGLLSVGTNFVSDVVNFIGKKFDRTEIALTDLTEANNYYLTYKCAVKNFDQLYCAQKEEEDYTDDNLLSELDKKSKEIDALYPFDFSEYKNNKNSRTGKRYNLESVLKETGEFGIFRDLNDHNYRLIKIIDKVEKIFSSTEVLSDKSNLFSLQNRIERMELIQKLPPLKSKFFVDAWNSDPIFGLQPRGNYSWSSWDQNVIEWSTWIHNFGYSFSSSNTSDFLMFQVYVKCQDPAVSNLSELSGVYDSNRNVCSPEILTKDSQREKFIELVFVPALLEVYREMKRLNDKIKKNPTIGSLYAEIKNQEDLVGDKEINKYPLSTLLNLYKVHTSKFVSSSAYDYAVKLGEIIDSLKLLIQATDDIDHFRKIAAEVYDTLATISNNGVAGGVLYRVDLDNIINSYFDEVTTLYLFTDLEKAEKFVLYNHLRDLYLSYELQQSDLDSEGSSNLALYYDVEESFFRVFGGAIGKKLQEDINRYKKGKMIKRELIHSCALYRPYLGSFISDNYRKKRKFCDWLLHKEGGISYLKNGKKKYSINQGDSPSYGDRCYYRNYSRESVVEKMVLYRQRVYRK